MGKPVSSLPILEAAVREIDIRGVFRYANCYPTALSMIASGTVNVKPMVTHRFRLGEVTEAFRAAKEMRDNAIKVMIDCSPKQTSCL